MPHVTAPLPPRRLALLMEQAADLRANGLTWAEIGAILQRHTDTVQRWSRHYPELWQRYYRQAEAQLALRAGTEATAVEWELLQNSPDQDIRRDAAQALLRKAQSARLRASPPTPAKPMPPEVARVQAFLQSLSEEQLQRLLTDFLAYCSQAADCRSPEGPVPPATVPPA